MNMTFFGVYDEHCVSLEKHIADGPHIACANGITQAAVGASLTLGQVHARSYHYMSGFACATVVNAATRTASA